ncbi:MAG: hypothetical protein HYX84_06260 [Chloroflexi bacterium]|nr:hypothetical protein [Chloroflexota bacterium]
MVMVKDLTELAPLADGHCLFRDEGVEIKERSLYNVHGVFIPSSCVFFAGYQSYLTRKIGVNTLFLLLLYVRIRQFRGWLT